MQRLIQTTVASEHSESAISVIFVSNTSSDDVPHSTVVPSYGAVPSTPTVQHRDEVSKPDHIQTLRGLGLTNIIDLPLSSAIDVSWMVNAFFAGDYANTDTDLIAYVLDNNAIIIEQSPPELTSLTSFLQKSTGVAIGAYVGVAAATALGNPLLMFITVPFGMLIVGTAAGVGSALELGLRDRVLTLLKVQAKLAKRTTSTTTQSHHGSGQATPLSGAG